MDQLFTKNAIIMYCKCILIKKKNDTIYYKSATNLGQELKRTIFVFLISCQHANRIMGKCLNDTHVPIKFYCLTLLQPFINNLLREQRTCLWVLGDELHS